MAAALAALNEIKKTAQYLKDPKVMKKADALQIYFSLSTVHEHSQVLPGALPASHCGRRVQKRDKYVNDFVTNSYRCATFNEDCLTQINPTPE